MTAQIQKITARILDSGGIVELSALRGMGGIGKIRFLARIFGEVANRWDGQRGCYRKEHPRPPPKRRGSQTVGQSAATR